MIDLLRSFMELCKEKSVKIKHSIVFGFFDGIFESFPFMAIFYLFSKLAEVDFNPEKLILKDILIISAIFLIGVIGRWIMKYKVYTLQSVAGYDAVADARCDIGDHLKKVPMGYFTSKSIGDTVTTLTDDMHFMEQNAANILEKAINGSINVLVLTLSMMFFDIRMGVLFLIGALISFAIINSLQKSSAESAAELKKSQLFANNKIIEYLEGITVYKLFPDSKESDNDIKSVFKNLRDSSYKMEKSFILKNFLYLLTERFVCGVIIFLTAYFAMNGSLSIVKAAVLLMATFVLYKPLENLGSITGMVRIMDISMNHIKDTEKLAVMDGNNKQAMGYDIKLDNVSFSYENSEEVISGVTVNIPANKLTAIVGPSGCGKTTLTRLIARFWDADKGSVKIGGTDVKDINPEELYSYFSIVFQNVFLFNDTIENNIKFGKPTATHEEVVAVAKKACCHEFIEKLENGYETMAGESGENLSGGERQRIAMARAILKDAPIVILDEATSSVDPENEWMMKKAINELLKGKTVIMIAHKMSTIMNADQIIVMESGRIHGVGTHSQLVKSDDIYNKFWNARKQASDWKI